jgi:hypothetical protein
MSIDVLVLCRRSPLPLADCPAATISLLPVRSMRAHRAEDDVEPELAHKRATRVDIYAHELAAIVELTCRSGGYALTLAYAELIARAYDGAVVVDGDLVFEARESLRPDELAAAWAALDRRAHGVLPQRRHAQPPPKDDWSSV